MTKSHYPYPPDEFDVRGPEGAPVGVHREPRSGWSSIWPFLLVAVIFAGLAVGVVSFLSGNGGSDDPPTASDVMSEEATEGDDEGELDDVGDDLGDGTDDPGDDGDAEGDGLDDGDVDGDVDGDGGDGADAGGMPGDASMANLSARVVVYNDGAGDGQAGAGRDALVGAGFSDIGIDNATAAPVTLTGVYTETTVLYGSDRADTATAIAEAVGASPANVQESADVTNHPTDAVWVILKTPVG